MPSDFDSVQHVDQLIEALQEVSDDQVLTRLSQAKPLPDEDDPRWDDLQFWVDAADPFDALARVACSRKLLSAVSLILERMCFGDPGETMRPICHGFEYIVNPEWHKLFPIYALAAESPRPGTRMWALFCMARLRTEDARTIFERFLNDSEADVRAEAERGLRMLGNL